MSNRKSYMILGLTILLTIISTAQSESNITDTDAQIYLSKFGYLPAFDSSSSHAGLSDENTYTKAIEDFQKFAGLHETGVLDEDTKKVMSLPRCGVPDKVVHTSNRSKRYATEGSQWPVNDLTYKILNYPANLTEIDVDAEIARAFALWSEYTDLTFTPKRTGNVDIEIKFVSGAHGDDYPFDGRDGFVGHGFFPRYGGDVHFDAAELWTINVTYGTNLFQAAAHEFGHALGLLHSNISSALMAPIYRHYIPNFKLHDDDILGIQNIYGHKTFQGVRPNKDVCKDPKIDAIFRSAEGQTYIFMGEYYYELSDEWPMALNIGYPKLISEGWPGLPGNIDAAFTYIGGKTYFFKGTQCWQYNGTQLDEGYPKKINEVVAGIPDNLDAAMVWGNKGIVYFFKGSKFWRFDPRKNPATVTSYIKYISKWKGLPINLDAAIQHNGYTYFFKDDKFYMFLDNMRVFSDDKTKPYPYHTAIWLFNCLS